MNYGSLFSGIGGFDLGFERAGMTCRWQCEIDKHAQGILRKHFNAEVYDDVRTIGKAAGAVDLVCGGFPCQDLSIAGKRKGLAGERSGLWFEFARVIDELEPRWVVIENVPGLLSSNRGRDFAVILQWLVKRGYGVCWRVLDAQYFGVPQRRRRVFIVASFGNGSAAEVLFESEGLRGDTPTRGKTGEDVAYSLRSNPSHSGDKGDGGINTTLIPSRSIAQSLTSSNTQNNGGGGITDRSTPTLIVMAHGQANAEIVSDGEPSLTRNHEAPIVFQQNTRDEVRLMGGDGRYAGALAAEPGAKQQNYIAWSDQGGERMDFSNNTSPTLRAQTHGHTPMVGVRRLTPVECERLQGFPDGWTEGQADTQRYKQLGNAVAVPVIEWIGKRIMEVNSP